MNVTEGLNRSAPEPGTAHLAVLHHGLWGSCRDLYFVEARLIESGWLVLNSTCNSERYTYDGIDVCGDRLVRETRSCCNRWLSKGIRVSKISFIGYSLGGLVVRYAIGKLLATGFFIEVQPVNVVTFASPHLGAYRQPGATATERLCNIILPWTLSRTGAQLVLGDDYLGGLPLLFVMAHPQYAFVQALQCFENRILLANVKGDTTVPYFSAAMCVLNPFERSPGVPLSAKYPCIINTEHRNWGQLLGPSTADGLPPPANTIPQFGPLPLLSPPPSPAPVQSQYHPLLCKQGSSGTVGLDGAQGYSQHSNATARGGPQQPGASTALQIVNSGSRLSHLHTSMGRVRIHDQSFAPAVRQGVPLNLRLHGHPLSLRQLLAGGFPGRHSRQRDVVAGRQGDLYPVTAGWQGGVGRFDRHDRSGRKLGRLDSTSFILLLPLFLMVWVFMVALLTLWGMRHYLTRVSIGIPRDRSWAVHVMSGDNAVMAEGRDQSGGGGGVSRRSSDDSSALHRMYTNRTPNMEREGCNSISTLRIRGPGSSLGGSGSASSAAMRISHTSDDLSGDECDSGSPLQSVADEIRGMTAARREISGYVVAAATSPASPSVWAMLSDSPACAQSAACSSDGRPSHTNLTSQADNGRVNRMAADEHEHEPLHSHLQPITPQQQDQQPWLWSPLSNALPQLLKATNTMLPAALFQSGEAACSTHSCCNQTEAEISTLPLHTHLNKQCKQEAPSQDSLLASVFPALPADNCAHLTDTQLLTSKPITHSHPQGYGSSSSGCSLAFLCKLCEAHLSTGQSCAAPSQDAEHLRESQVGMNACISSLPSQASGSRPHVRRKLRLYSEEELSACEIVAQCSNGGVSVAVASVTCSATMETVYRLPQQSVSSSSSCSGSSGDGGRSGDGSGRRSGSGGDSHSSSGMEDVCSSGEFSIECVDAESHARSLCLAGSSGALQPLSEVARNEMPSIVPRTCLAHPLASGRHSRSCSPTHRNTSASSPAMGCSNHRDLLVLPCVIPGTMSSAFHNSILTPPAAAAAAAVVVTARLATTSTTSLITSTAKPHTWFVLAGSAASSALLKSASLIPGSSLFGKIILDPEAFSLRPALGLSRRQWQDVMMENMNGLRWQKIHVDTHHYHAHAAIVVRSYRRFPAQEHIVEYMVRQMRL